IELMACYVIEQAVIRLFECAGKGFDIIGVLLSFLATHPFAGIGARDGTRRKSRLGRHILRYESRNTCIRWQRTKTGLMLHPLPDANGREATKPEQGECSLHISHGKDYRTAPSIGS